MRKVTIILLVDCALGAYFSRKNVRHRYRGLGAYSSSDVALRLCTTIK